MQLALAACAKAGGGWACPGVTHPLMASASQPIIPPSWTVPNWDIDPANITGCASDSNSGTSSTCGTSGIGPLKTYQELNVHRWGCLGNPIACPRLRQSTTITFLSSQTDGTDPVYFTPGVENGALVMIQGVLTAAQQVCSTTLSAVTSKSIASNQLLDVAFTSCAGAAANQLVVNSTHSSRAWIYKSDGGGGWDMGQPLTPQAPPKSIFTGIYEVNTWAHPDSVVVYNPVQINLATYEPQYIDQSSLPSFYQATVFDPSGIFADETNVSAVVFWESLLQRSVSFVSQQGVSEGEVNSVFLGNINNYEESGPNDSTFVGYGGIIGDTAVGSTAVVSTQDLDFDVIYTTNLPTFFSYGSVYLTGSGPVDVWGAAQPVSTFLTPALWGNEGINLVGSAHFTYPALAGAAAATFKTSGSLQVNGQGVGCIGIPSAASAYATCNVTLTAAHLDSDLGTTSGCIGAPNGGAFCNY